MSSYLDRIKVPRLGANRFGVYYVRWSVPGPGGRRRVFQQSLGTKDVARAKVLALQFCLILADARGRTPVQSTERYEFDPISGKMKVDGPEDHDRFMEAIERLQQIKQKEVDLGLRSAAQTQQALEQLATMLGDKLSAAVTGLGSALQQSIRNVAIAAPPQDDDGMSLKDATEQHLEEEKRRGKVHRTIQEKAALFKEFLNFSGDVALNSIGAPEIGEWRKEEFKRKSQKNPTTKISPGRLEKRRGYLSRFFEWAREVAGYPHPNPMGAKMASKREIMRVTKHYTPFSDDDVAKLFGPTFSIKMNKPDWYWLPLMALYSGARLGELANLAVADFGIHDDVKFYLIRIGKTADSRRVVPLHSALIDFGLWEYVEHLRSLGQTHLFGHRPPTMRSKSLGLRWGKWVADSGIKDNTKVFHSFRSTVITDLYAAAAPNGAAIRDTVGHSGGMRGVHGIYVSTLPMETLVKTMEDIRYDFLDRNALKLADPTFKDFFEAHLELNLDAKAAERAARKRRHLEARAGLLERSKRKRSRTGVEGKKAGITPLKSQEDRRSSGNK